MTTVFLVHAEVQISTMLSWLRHKTAAALVRFLTRPVRHYEPFSVGSPEALRRILRPADVLLVEGNQRFSAAVKYLTQSTWSHAAMYVGDRLSAGSPGSDLGILIEADIDHGVNAVPLSKYRLFNTRICRPVGLAEADRQSVVDFMVASIGMAYDLKNITDLLRYLIPIPPVPVRWRRRMLALGSGDPTRVICSTRIAQAFQAVGYPILPHIEKLPVRACTECRYTVREILSIRHHSLFTPRDFDLSPYFSVIKPTIESGFSYRDLVWSEKIAPTDPAPATADFPDESVSLCHGALDGGDNHRLQQ